MANLGTVGRHSTVVAFALPDPAAPGSNPGVPDIFSEKIKHFQRINCRCCQKRLIDGAAA